jgi:hypothetical protein
MSSNMQTTDEYKAAVSHAVAFKHENPDEKALQLHESIMSTPLQFDQTCEEREYMVVERLSMEAIIRCFQMRRLKLYTSCGGLIFKWLWCN